MPKGKKTEKSVAKKPVEEPAAYEPINRAKFVRLVVVILFILLLVSIGAAFSTSPEPIRNPKFEHYHFRMQLIVDGKPVDFGEDKFQTVEKGPANCDVDLTEAPIHFHDNKDQFVHIHWDGMTGGLVLKNYGWNFIGGPDTRLGYTFSDFPQMRRVPIHSDSLPQIPDEANLYVYTGDETSFIKRDFADFRSQDLETFFGKRSYLSEEKEPSSWLGRLFPNASAHGAVNDGHTGENSQEELKRLNNLIGNVVIFVQENEPTPEQVRQRFQNLVPLNDSACAG